MKLKFLIKKKGAPQNSLNHYQKQVVNEIADAIKNEKLQLFQNKCMCGNSHDDKDLLITETDCWGIPIGQVLCSRCGLIRNKYIFSSESNVLFYENYYRRLYNSDTNIDYNYFAGQKNRGASFVKLLEDISIINSIDNVVEFGCGAGGVLLPFAELGKKVTGVDLNNGFMELGIKSGLNLIAGQFKDIVDDNSCDLVILSHVLEHFADPISQIAVIVSKIKLNKYLLVQIPGLFSNPKPNYPLSGFQVAHVFYFYKDWLSVLFKTFGLKVLYSDEVCTFICQKVCEDIPDVQYVYDESLADYPVKMLTRIIECKKKYEKELKQKKKNKIKEKLYIIACHLGWRKIRSYIKRNG